MSKQFVSFEMHMFAQSVPAMPWQRTGLTLSYLFQA